MRLIRSTKVVPPSALVAELSPELRLGHVGAAGGAPSESFTEYPKRPRVLDLHHHWSPSLFAVHARRACCRHSFAATPRGE